MNPIEVVWNSVSREISNRENILIIGYRGQDLAAVVQEIFQEVFIDNLIHGISRRIGRLIDESYYTNF